MANLPTLGWDVVGGMTVSILQEVANTNYATNEQLLQAWDGPPTIALNAANQIVFTVEPKRYTGAYDVALDLAAVTVTQLPEDDTGSTGPSYQMCFTSTPFSVTASTGGNAGNAIGYAASLNHAVGNQCLSFNIDPSKNASSTSLDPQAQALLKSLAPKLMVFASLVDSQGAAVGQLLVPFMSTASAPPSGDVFSAFSGDDTLDVASQSAQSNAMYALWDYFVLNSLLKPTLAQSLGIEESEITVSTAEPAVLKVDGTVKLKKGGTLSGMTVQFVDEGVQISATVDIEKNTEIAGVSYHSEVSGGVTITLALAPDNSTSPATIGLTVISVSSDLDPEELAQWVAVGIAAEVYAAFGAFYYLFFILTMVIFAVVLLILFELSSATVDTFIENEINDKLADQRQDLPESITIDKVLYGLGMVTFLAYDPNATSEGSPAAGPQ